MREILFRALSMCRGEHWVYGQVRHYAKNPHTEKWTIYDPNTGIETDIDEETIGQYTGYTDRNGRKVFESDIVRHRGGRPHIYDIVFHNGAFCFDHTEMGYPIQMASYDIGIEVMVIGNVYDNRELLKGGKE